MVHGAPGVAALNHREEVFQGHGRHGQSILEASEFNKGSQRMFITESLTARRVTIVSGHPKIYIHGYTFGTS